MMPGNCRTLARVTAIQPPQTQPLMLKPVVTWVAAGESFTSTGAASGFVSGTGAASSGAFVGIERSDWLPHALRTIARMSMPNSQTAVLRSEFHRVNDAKTEESSIGLNLFMLT